MNSNPDLLPCPFCGSRAYVCKYEEGIDGSLYWKVECENCYGNMRRAPTKDSAILEWNKRVEHRLKTETMSLLDEEDTVEF